MGSLRGNIGQKKSLKNFFESYYFWNSFWQRRALQLVIIKKTTMILLYTGHHTLLDYWLDLGLFTLYQMWLWRILGYLDL